MFPSGPTPSGHVAFAPVYVAPLHSRKFKEARDEHPRIAARILLLTGSIYQVEKRLR